MFNRKNLNDLFREFDSMFGGFDSMFGGIPNNGKTESGTDEFGDWTKETYKSPDGGVLITSFVRTGGNYKPNQSSGTTSLKKKLQIAIEEENFEEAVKLRDEIKKLETNQDEIKKIELELKKSIEDQDFEKSIELRDQLKKLKS
jgi:hypothetical protein